MSKFKWAAAPRPPVWKISVIIGIGILSVSTAAIFIRLALRDAGNPGVGFSLVLAASRLTLAALMLLPTWKNFHRTPAEPPALYYSGASGLFLALHFATWITSLSYTSIAASTTLVTTNPIWVALLSWIWFGERPTVLTSAGITIACLGGVLVALEEMGPQISGSQPLLGNFLALVGSWAISLYFLLGREAQRKGLSIGHHVVLVYTIAALTLLPLPLLFGVSYIGYSYSVYIYIALMALFPQLIGHTSFNWAVRWISPTFVTLLILMEPLGSGLLGILAFGEIPTAQVIVGAITILIGVAIAAVGTQKSCSSKPDPAD
jgi:drug/metabolite transporter (DMT)-like permease